VVRHKLVQRIVNAYKAHDDEVGAARAQRSSPSGRHREGSSS
jgi:phosphate starvation-inducible protein PhoH